jgi:hypothetical protein
MQVYASCCHIHPIYFFYLSTRGLIRVSQGTNLRIASCLLLPEYPAVTCCAQAIHTYIYSTFPALRAPSFLTIIPIYTPYYPHKPIQAMTPAHFQNAPYHSATTSLGRRSRSIYLPALNPLAKDLNATASTINISITLYIVVRGIAPTLLEAFPTKMGAGRRLRSVM